MKQYSALFRNRNFLFHWLAGAVSNVGDFFNSLALVKILSADPEHLGFYLSLIMVSKVLPNLVLGPVAGAVADRLPRRMIMIVSDLVRAGLVLALVFVEQPAVIIGLVFGAAIAASFYNPASSAMLPSLVQQDELVTAGSLNVMTQRMAMLLGNGIGAVVLVAVGAHNVFYIDAVSFVLSALLLSFVVAPPVVRAASTAAQSLWAKFAGDMSETVAFLRATPPVRHLFLSLGISSIGDAALSVGLVPFYTLGLGLAAEKLGFVWAFFGGASVLGALFIGALGRKIHWRHLFAFGAAYVWAMMLGILLSGNLFASIAFLTLLGLGSGAINVGLQAAVGELVPDQVRGRVFGAWGTFSSPIWIAGVISAGVASDRFGPKATLMGYSLAFLVCGIYAFIAFRGLPAKQPAVQTAAVGD